MYKAIFSNENNYNVDNIDERWLINGEKVTFDCHRVNKSSYHLIFNDRSIYVTLVSFDRNEKSFTFLIDEKQFTLKVEDKYDQLLTKMGMEAGNLMAVSEFKAPMPGLVLDVLVSVGDQVVKDQPLVILEAMKMENALKSAGDGVIAEIQIKKNDKVDKNQVLIRFE